MLPVCVVLERLSASPLLCREMWKLRKEYPGFRARFLQPPELRQRSGQDASYARPTRCFVPQCFYGVLISTQGILGPSKKPVIVSWGMRVETKGVVHTVDALGRTALEHPQVRE